MLKNMMRKILFSILNDNTINLFYQIYYRVRYPGEMKKLCCFGNKNPDKTFYIIRPRSDCTEGLMSLFINAAKNIHYAKENGYEPIIDFLNYKSQYQNEDGKKINSWEVYFTQPTIYSLEEVYKSKNVILSGLEIQWYSCKLYKINFSDKALRTLHQDIFSKIQFSNDILMALYSELDKLCLNFEKTLGLYVRGTDYTLLKPSGHPVQPTVDQVMEIADQYLGQYNIEKIFLVTEDGNIHDIIKKRYGKRCVVASFDSFITDYNEKKYLSHSLGINKLGDSSIQRGINYLVKLIILSKCAYFVGGKTMGSWAACIFSEQNFKSKYIFDLGVYGK